MTSPKDDCPTDKPWRWSLLSDKWEQVGMAPYLLGGQVVLDSLKLGKIVLSPGPEFPGISFKADRIVAVERPNRAEGWFKLVSQTVGDRPQSVFVSEVEAVLFTVDSPFGRDRGLDFDLCLPGEEICILVRNDGPETAELRLGLVGTLWRPKMVRSRS